MPTFKPYSLPPNVLQTRPLFPVFALMKTGFAILLAILLAILVGMILFPRPSMANTTLPVQISWSYDISIPDLGGYIIYKDGMELCVINDPATSDATLNVPLRTGINSFSMSAFNIYGFESSLSEPLNVELPPEGVAGNLLPVAEISASAFYSVSTPFTVVFDAWGSTDIDGQILEYSWDFGDGQIGFGQSINHTFYQTGIYFVTLTVTDNSGAQHSKLTEIFVGSAYNPVIMGQDDDGDGLTNLEEFQAMTDRYISDTDSDGIDDGFDGAPLNNRASLCADLARNDKMGTVYQTITDAYYDPDLLNGDTIEVTAANFPEDLRLDREIAITLAGGFYCSYADNPAWTAVNSLTIIKGTVKVENLLIQ